MPNSSGPSQACLFCNRSLQRSARDSGRREPAVELGDAAIDSTER
jgi:hypothetical protein